MKESEQINQKIINLQKTLPSFNGKELRQMEEYIEDQKLLYENALEQEKEAEQQQPATPPVADDDYEKQRQEEAKQDIEKADSGYQKTEPKFRKGQQVEAEGYDQPLIVIAFANKDGEIMLILLTGNGEKVEMSQGKVIVFGIYLGKPSDEEAAQGEADFKVFALQLGSGKQGGETVDLPPEDYQQQDEKPEQPQLPEKGSADTGEFNPEDIKGGFEFKEGGGIPYNAYDFNLFIKNAITSILPIIDVFTEEGLTFNNVSISTRGGGKSIYFIFNNPQNTFSDFQIRISNHELNSWNTLSYENVSNIITPTGLFKVPIDLKSKIIDKKLEYTKYASGGSIPDDEMVGKTATLHSPYYGYRTIELIEKRHNKWLVKISNSGKELEVYEDEFELTNL